MPGYKGHLIGGAIAFSCMIIMATQCCRYSPTFFTAVELFVCALLGALFPDVDTKSRGQGIFYRIILCLVCVVLAKKQYISAVVISCAALTPLLVAHRGLFHRPWFLFALPFVFLVVAAYAGINHGWHYTWHAIFFLAGAFSHLMLDRYV